MGIRLHVDLKPVETIFYTVDGTTPSLNSLQYWQLIELDNDATIKAFALFDDGTIGPVSQASYTFSARLPRPRFIAPSGANTNTSVSISVPGYGDALIYYTVDGSAPSDTNGTLYSTPVALTGDTTLKAVGYKDGWRHSLTATAYYGPANYAFGGMPNVVFSPSAGALVYPVSVTLTCPNHPLATILYETDGTTPNYTSAVYSGVPVEVNSGVIKAFAFELYHTPSAVSTATYTQLQVGTPVFNPVASAVVSGSTVSLSTSTSGAVLYYTVDGTTPDSTSAQYSVPIVLSPAETVKAIGYKPGYLASAVASANYTQAVTATPTAIPNGGAVVWGSTVALSCATSGSSIYYTVDGSVPTVSSTLYTGPVEILTTTPIKAIGIAPGYLESAVMSKSFTQAVTATPTALPNGGAVVWGSTVALSCATSGASFYYTVDGTDPTVLSTLYSSPIVINSAFTLKAIGIAPGYLESAVMSKSFTQAVTATPTAIPNGGAVVWGSTVALSCLTAGSSIYYTVDGSVPDSTATLYSSPIVINSDFTLKAIGIAPGYQESAVMSKSFTQAVTATPTLNPAGDRLWSTTTPNTTTVVTGSRWFGAAANNAGTLLYACSYPLGQSGRIVTSSDFGNIWTNRTPTSSRNWRDIACSNNGVKAIAVGNGYMALSTDSGATWTDVSAMAGKALNFCASSGDGVKLYAGEYGGRNWASNNSGATWTAYGINANWNGIACSDNGVYVTACAAGGYVYKSYDSGVTYTVTIATVENWYCVTMSSDGMKQYASTYAGAVWGTVNAGASWNQTSNLTHSITSMSCSADGGTVFACGDSGYFSRSTDQGYTWVRSGNLGLPAYAIRCSADGNRIVIAAGSPAGGGIFTAVNGTLIGSTVALSCATSGSSIYYTVDGTTPDSTDTLYSTPITVNTTETIKAIGVKTNYLDSAVGSGSYIAV